MARQLAVLVAFALLAPAPAHAQMVQCQIARTPQGFVALRAAPRADARLVARLRRGDEVAVVNDHRRVAGWSEVDAWRGPIPYDRSRAGGVRHGWVQTRFLVDCDI